VTGYSKSQENPTKASMIEIETILFHIRERWWSRWGGEQMPLMMRRSRIVSKWTGRLLQGLIITDELLNDW